MIRRKKDMTPQDKPAGGSQDMDALPDRPTINDIARFAAVSKKTVSRVLNKSPFVAAQTREKIEAIIARTSYSPHPQSRGPAFRRSFLMGIVFDNPNPQYLANLHLAILYAVRGSA